MKNWFLVEYFMFCSSEKSAYASFKQQNAYGMTIDSAIILVFIQNDKRKPPYAQHHCQK